MTIDISTRQDYKSDAFLTTQYSRKGLASVSASSRESGVFAVKSEAANFAGKLWGALKIHSKHDAAAVAVVVVEISKRSFVQSTTHATHFSCP